METIIGPRGTGKNTKINRTCIQKIKAVLVVDSEKRSPSFVYKKVLNWD